MVYEKKNCKSKQDLIEMFFCRMPFWVLVAGVRNKYIRYEVSGGGGIPPGNGGDGGRGGFGGEPGKVILIGLDQKPKCRIFNQKGFPSVTRLSIGSPKTLSNSELKYL